MEFKDLIEQAKKISKDDLSKKKERYFVKTIAWLHHLGLLRHNKITPQRFVVTLDEALEAGKLEPRVLELIPAILIVLPKALKFKKDEIPLDLAIILRSIRERKATKNFRGVTPRSYLHWVNSPAMDLAKRRINPYRMPRRRSIETHAIGSAVREGRLSLSLTQKQLATKYKLSLRIIRDLEQGKLDASLKATNQILSVFGRTLTA